MASPINIKLEGAKKLNKRLKSVDRRTRRKLQIRVMRKSMKPVMSDAKRMTPVHTGRLRASIGMLAKRRTGTLFIAQVGTRRDFKFTSTKGTGRQKLSVGRGQISKRDATRGYARDKGGHPNMYAGGIEFGVTKSGRVARRAGPAKMLNAAMQQHSGRIVSTIVRDINSELDKA